jgi:hypothetical protein
MLQKHLARAPTLLQGFGGYTRRCASAPPRNRIATRREECPISKHQSLRIPDGYHRRGSGATVGDSHKGPLITEGKPIFSQITKTQMSSQIINYTQNNHALVIGAHGPGNLGSPSNGRPQPPQAKLRFARGAQRRTAGTPPRSRPGRPLGRDSASL